MRMRARWISVVVSGYLLCNDTSLYYCYYGLCCSLRSVCLPFASRWMEWKEGRVGDAKKKRDSYGSRTPPAGRRGRSVNRLRQLCLPRMTLVLRRGRKELNTGATLAMKEDDLPRLSPSLVLAYLPLSLDGPSTLFPANPPLFWLNAPTGEDATPNPPHDDTKAPARAARQMALAFLARFGVPPAEDAARRRSGIGSCAPSSTPSSRRPWRFGKDNSGGIAVAVAAAVPHDDTSAKFAVRASSRPTGFLPKEGDKETDKRRLSQRQKQIDLGKRTDAYRRYAERVPKHARKRKGRIPIDPVTPDITKKCSKRSFDGQVKAWKRQLHALFNDENRIGGEGGSDESAKEPPTKKRKAEAPLADYIMNIESTAGGSMGFFD